VLPSSRGAAPSLSAMDDLQRGTAAETGRRGEDLAVGFLERAGYRVRSRNWRPTGLHLRGELDLVAELPGTLVVVEVKARRSAAHGGALAAVTPAKQARIRRLARAYLAACGSWYPTVRFDVIAVDLSGPTPKIEHVKEAFW
jgi:putative endonuclease